MNVYGNRFLYLCPPNEPPGSTIEDLEDPPKTPPPKRGEGLREVPRLCPELLLGPPTKMAPGSQTWHAERCHLLYLRSRLGNVSFALALLVSRDATGAKQC